MDEIDTVHLLEVHTREISRVIGTANAKAQRYDTNAGPRPSATIVR